MDDFLYSNSVTSFGYVDPLANWSDDQWNWAAGDNTRVTGPIYSGEINETGYAGHDAVLQVYNDFSEAILGSPRTMTAGYADDQSYLNAYGVYHSGIDIDAVSGTPVKSLVDGEVVFTSPDFYGVVTIEDDTGKYHIYKHLEQTHVQEGDLVSSNDVIGTVGGRGEQVDSFIPHLHYEVSQPDYYWGGVHNPDVRSNQELLRNRNYNPLKTFW